MKNKKKSISDQFFLPPIRKQIYAINSHIVRVKIEVEEDNVAERNFRIISDSGHNQMSEDNITSFIENFEKTYTYSFSDVKDDLNQRSWSLSRPIAEGESFYGLGDKPLTLDIRGRKLTNWGTDTYAYNYGADPLYKNISFFIFITDAFCGGIFINNTYKLYFDFGHHSDKLTISAPGGIPDLYFISGSSPVEVLRQYAHLTGLPDLPPLWALGYHQSKWSYYPERYLKKVCTKFRKLKIPCDAVYLDIDYMDGYRVFTWNKTAFPQPEALLAKLKAKGFKTVAIIDPGIKIDKNYDVYNEGVAQNLFVKNKKGQNYEGPVWPGYCHFPDFTGKKVREWWAEKVHDLMNIGLDGIWNDMNEPALFNKDDMIQTQRTFDDDVIMNFEEDPGLFTEGHNVYGLLMSEATYDGVAKNNIKRPFVLTRSTFSGGQKYAAVWTGDNVASWEHLKIANYQNQMLSISGFSFTGSDIGGFVGVPDGELYTRWLQLAIFHPFFRTHSSKDFAEQEPWSYGDQWTNISRSLISWRYRLLGYIYSTFQEHTNSGSPMLMPISLIHWKDKGFKSNFNEFYFGGSLLITPVLEPGQSGCRVNLPEGIFYNLNNYKKINGGQAQFITVPSDGVPALLLEGHVLPIWPVMQYTGEKTIKEVELLCGFSKNSSVISQMYLDDFDGLDYKRGKSIKMIFTYSYHENEITISVSTIGKFEHGISDYSFKMFGLDHPAKTVFIDNQKVKSTFKNSLLQFKINAQIPFHEIKIIL